MALTPVNLNKVQAFQAKNPAQFDQLLQGVQENKPQAKETLAKAIGISKLDVLDLAQQAVEALATNTDLQVMLKNQTQATFQADAGGKGTGGTLAMHGHFDAASVSRNTVIRRHQGGQVRGITPLVSGVPKNPYAKSFLRDAAFKSQVPKMEDPTDKWDVFPMGNEYTTAQCKASLDKVQPEVEALLGKFQGIFAGENVALPIVDFHVALKPLIAAATKKALDTLPDDLAGESPNLLRKHLAHTIAGEGAKLVDDMTFPSDPERQFTDFDLKKHVTASVVKGALAAFDIKDASSLLKTHNASKTVLGDGSLDL